MLKFIKSFFVKAPANAPVAEYKVETPLVQSVPEPTLMPAGTEASVAAPVTVVETAPVVAEKPAKKAKVAANPKSEKVAKVIAGKKTRTPRNPKASKAE